MVPLDSIFIPQNLVFLAGALYVAGMAITNQIILRFFILAGSCIYLFYYGTINETPLWEAIYVSLLIIVANIFGLSSLIARRSRLAIPRAHADIFDDFPDLPPGDFRSLMKLATRQVLKEDKQLTAEGDAGTKLYYVLNGDTLLRKGEQAFVLPPKMFLGEIAFLVGTPSSASAWLEAGSELLEWDFGQLKRKCAKSARFKLALEAAISMDLAQKVAVSTGKNAVPVASIPENMVHSLATVPRP